MQRFALILLASAFLAAPAAEAKKVQWDIDPAHSSVGFVARHLVVAKVRGKFQKYDAKIILDEEDISKSVVEVTIDVSSIDTDNARRDAHLKSDDFFNAQKFPKMKFVSKSVKKRGDGRLVIVGDLTIRETTKSVVLEVNGPSAEVKDPAGRPHIAFSAETEVNRFDYGLKWNKAVEGGGYVVAETIKIEIELQLMNKRPAEAK